MQLISFFCLYCSKEYDEYGFLKYSSAEDGPLPSRAKQLDVQANELNYMIRVRREDSYMYFKLFSFRGKEL